MTLAFLLLSLIVLVSLCPAIAAEQITCGAGDVRYKIDLKAIALGYEGQTVTAVLDSFAILKTRVSVDPKTLQQATEATQLANEFLKALVVSFNNCAITKGQYVEALKSLSPQLKTQAKELDEIRNLLTQGRRLDEKRLQDILKQYTATLQKLVSLTGLEQIMKKLQAIETHVVTGTETLKAGLEDISKRLDRMEQSRPSLPDPNLPEKEVDQELAEVDKELTSLSEKVKKEYVEGKKDYYEGKFETAISHFTIAIDLAPRIPSLYLDLGNIYIDSYRHDDAIATYDRGLSVAKQSEMVYAKLIANRGYAKEALGQHQGAMDDLSLAIDLIPNHSGPYIARGVLKYRLNDFTGALKDYTAAIERSPDSADAYYNHGLAEAQLKNYQGAIKDFTKSIELSPDHADVYQSRGTVKVWLKDHTGAIDDYTVAIKKNPDNAEIHNLRCEARLLLKHYSGAVDDCTAAINLKPSVEMLKAAYWFRGFAHNELGNKKEARDDFNRAQELDPKPSIQESSTH
ncbi:MAG: tetratricopeptide repeat protein [Nitrospira sp.]|nr:MAG: tetratricopeptide repeat protein [Nitrospira sp.]